MNTNHCTTMATLLMREAGVRPGDNISPELTGAIASAVEEALRCCDRRLREAEARQISMRTRYKDEIAHLHELRRMDDTARQNLGVAVFALLDHARETPGGSVEVSLPVDAHSTMTLRFTPPREDPLS